MKKIFKYPLMIIFLAIIFVIPILTWLNYGEKVSNIENRTLASKPVYSREKLLSGEYFPEWEEFISDHIYERDQWIKFHTLLNINVLNKKKINNIVLGKENTLLPYFTKELSASLKERLESLPIMIDNMNRIHNLTRKYGGKFVFVGVPGQSSFYQDRYYEYFINEKDYFMENEKTLFKKLKNRNISHINMNKIFREDYNENYYLKTDHHYSFEGSFKTYEEIIKSLDMKPYTKNELNITKLSKPIKGSRNRQIYYLQETEDKLQIAYPKEEVRYTKYTNGVEDNRLYYISENPEERPSYSIYMGGDHGEILIDTNRDDLPNLLLFGDSFTNALEPLLFNHFNQTRILDLRHYKGNTLEEYIKDHKPDFVILVRDDLNYGNLDGNGNF